MFDDEVMAAARAVVERASTQHCFVTAVESCTGGLVMAALTAVPGSSSVVAAGVVTYSNAMKQRLLHVSPETLRAHGAVSEACAGEMAMGGVGFARASLAVAITGIAGPGGGSAEKPVGTVCFGLANQQRLIACERLQFGDVGRDEVRRLSLLHALACLLRGLES
jgi:nicotinamide-nucleotide amidase